MSHRSSGWFVNLKGWQSLTGREGNANPVNLVSRPRRSAGMEAIREPKTRNFGEFGSWPMTVAVSDPIKCGGSIRTS
jgi:hypothetical protein